MKNFFDSFGLCRYIRQCAQHPSTGFPPIRSIFAVGILMTPTLPLQANSLPVGVNVVGALHANVATQDSMLQALKTAGVEAIRLGVPDNSEGIELLQRIDSYGLHVLLILDIKYPPDAPKRPFRPDEYPDIWGGTPLSSADPVVSRSYFVSLLSKVERAGIKLTGIELANEINGASFNCDFDIPGKHKAFGLVDLETGIDGEARQVAAGFVKYVAVIAALKDARDQLQINKNTPIISAGMVGYARDFSNAPEGAGDVVYQSDAIEYLHNHGLDKYVDGYGIHLYPSAQAPNDPVAAGQRVAHFEKFDLQQCRAPGAPGDKPCWITEWGFENNDLSTCRPDEIARSKLIAQMMPAFQKAAAEKRLAGSFYYMWSSDPWNKTPDPYSVIRCGKPTSVVPLITMPISVP